MLLNVQIQDHSFKLSIGSGLNDWTWLSHYAAKKFSKISYPQGAYLPSQLYLIDKQNQKMYPHPRQKINTFLQENKLNANHITTVVKLRKGNQVFTQSQKIWQNEAFGLQRMMMNVLYVLDTEKYKNKEGQKEFYFKVLLHYNMHNDVKHFFNEKNFVSPIQIQLEETKIDSKLTTFKGHTKLPFGDVTPQLYYLSRDPKDPSSYRSQKIKDIELKPDLFRVSLIISPKFKSIQQQNEAAAQQMKISQNITKSLQQKQLQTKKRNANSSLCCYSFEQFWKLLQQHHGDQLLLQQYDKSTRQRLKIILQKSLNSIYQIFFYYVIIQNQNKQKKEQLGVTYQHVMHFLIFYRVFDNLKSLNQFLEYYNSDFKFKNIKDTVDIQNKSVKFIQFVAILLRALQFLQTSTFYVKQQTFDALIASHIDMLIKIDGQQQQFCEFKRNIRQNPKIISYFRNTSPTLKQIFVNQIMKSTQKAGDKYVMMKQQCKSLLENSGLTNKNTDNIIQDLFEQLNFSEEGIFYYQFAEAIQWLALALVSSDKDNNQIQNQQEEAVLIIQKMKFFINKIQT